jgi:hypothetical protein
MRVTDLCDVTLCRLLYIWCYLKFLQNKSQIKKHIKLFSSNQYRKHKIVTVFNGNGWQQDTKATTSQNLCSICTNVRRRCSLDAFYLFKNIYLDMKTFECQMCIENLSCFMYRDKCFSP